MAENSTIGRISQGTIFSCAYAERYKGSPVRGVVITARCDMAQDKFPVMNYVPVVKLEDWIKLDGFEIVKERGEKQVRGERQSLLKEWQIAESVLVANKLALVIERYIEEARPRLAARVTSRAARVVQRVEGLEQLQAGDVSWLVKEFPALLDGVIKELMTHKLSGHYYLSNAVSSESSECHVALLREASFLPRDLALALGRGVSEDSLDFSRNPEWKRWIRFNGDDDMAMPIGQIGSPYIEHLLQTFGMLFGRIGLDDPEQGHIDRMCELIRQVG
jgi:hypothetical protein